MRKIFYGIFALVSFAAILISCAQNRGTSGTSGPAQPSTEARPASQSGVGGWEDEWQKTLAQARKEGKVIVYSSTGGDLPGQGSGLRKRVPPPAHHHYPCGGEAGVLKC